MARIILGPVHGVGCLRSGEADPVSAAVLRFEGQFRCSSHMKAVRAIAACTMRRRRGRRAPCSEAGVLGAVTGVMGTLQATETLEGNHGYRRNLQDVCWSGTLWRRGFGR